MSRHSWAAIALLLWAYPVAQGQVLLYPNGERTPGQLGGVLGRGWGALATGTDALFLNPGVCQGFIHRLQTLVGKTLVLQRAKLGTAHANNGDFVSQCIRIHFLLLLAQPCALPDPIEDQDNKP